VITFCVIPVIEKVNCVVNPKNRNWIISLSAVTAICLAVFSLVYLLYRPGSLVWPPQLASAIPSDSPSAWDDLLQATPEAYTTPLPDPVSSSIDGSYAKLVQSPPQWWSCRRCADYRLSGGIWKLQFDKGIMRVLYDGTGWRSLASFTVTDDRLYIFNDPYCPQEVGQYRWQLVNGNLDISVIEDACAFRLRGENFSEQTWSACPQHGSTPGEKMPVGCSDNTFAPQALVAPRLPLKVEVFGGDSRFFHKPPEVFALANAEEVSPPEGIQVTYSQQSVSFGLNRVLWWLGEWIEASTELPFSSLGVQFLGESQMGWARLILDGEVVWQGDTSEIGTEKGRHGGYIQVSGFEPGKHSIRVESMGFDYHPVTVASFGFAYKGGVEKKEP